MDLETPSEQRPRKKSHRNNVACALDPEVLARAKAAVYYTPGLSLVQLITEGLELALAERERRNGQPFPPYAGRLQAGRKIG